MSQRKSALAALLLTITLATPASTEQALVTPQSPANESCSGCFAYLEFPPLPEGERFQSSPQAARDRTTLHSGAAVSDRGANAGSSHPSTKQ